MNPLRVTLDYSLRFITFAKKKEMEELSKEEMERKNKVKAILHDIKVGKEKKILDGLKALKIQGDDEVIIPLIKIWCKGVSSSVDQAIIQFISDIKSSTSSSIIMDILLSDTYSSIHLPLLTTIWNSKVDYSDYLTDFVNIAVNHSDIMYSIESLTIIENLDGPFEEAQILDTQIILRDYADHQKDKAADSESKIQLISEIAQLITSFEKNLIA